MLMENYNNFFTHFVLDKNLEGKESLKESTLTPSSSSPSSPTSTPSSSLQLDRAIQNGESKDDDHQNSGQKCSNCGTMKTPLWRRNQEGKIICNACGLYLKANKSPRPMPIEKTTIRKVSKLIKCANCGTNSTSLWRRNDRGESVCNACGLYSKLRKVERPNAYRHKEVGKRNRYPKKQKNLENPTSDCSPSPEIKAQDQNQNQNQNQNQIQIQTQAQNQSNRTSPQNNTNNNTNNNVNITSETLQHSNFKSNSPTRLDDNLNNPTSNLTTSNVSNVDQRSEPQKSSNIFSPFLPPSFSPLLTPNSMSSLLTDAYLNFESTPGSFSSLLGLTNSPMVGSSNFPHQNMNPPPMSLPSSSFQTQHLENLSKLEGTKKPNQKKTSPPLTQSDSMNDINNVTLNPILNSRSPSPNPNPNSIPKLNSLNLTPLSRNNQKKNEVGKSKAPNETDLDVANFMVNLSSNQSPLLSPIPDFLNSVSPSFSPKLNHSNVHNYPILMPPPLYIPYSPKLPSLLSQQPPTQTQTRTDPRSNSCNNNTIPETMKDKLKREVEELQQELCIKKKILENLESKPNKQSEEGQKPLTLSDLMNQ